MSHENSDFPSTGVARTGINSGSPQIPAANRVVALECENHRLRQLVTELVQEKNLFSHIATRNW